MIVIVIFHVREISWFRSDVLMNGITVAALLVRQNIERNPGSKHNVSIRAFNCNGLGNIEKVVKIADMQLLVKCYGNKMV